MLRNIVLRLCSARHPSAAPKFAASIAAIAAFTVAPQAQAQFFFFDDFTPRYRQVPSQPRATRQAPRQISRQEIASQVKRAKRIEAAAAEVVPPSAVPTNKAIKPERDTPDAPLYAVVSIDDQHVSIYGARGLIERSDVSTGTADHPTPTGVFAIIQKERWHESNIYSGAQMPFMQRITWSGVAMHTGKLPGYPASHGCIRLPNEFAERWFGMTKLGLRVVVSPTDIESAEITHPNLPSPRYRAMAGTIAKRKPVQSAALSDETLAQYASPTEVIANPVAYAIAEKAKAKADLKLAEQEENAADAARERAGRAAKEALAALRSAESEFEDAEDRMGWFGLIGNRPPPPLKAKFGDGIMKAIADFEAANTRLSEATRANELAKAGLTEANAADKRAGKRIEVLKARITEMTRRQETVSIFISLKDRRLYVRQALRPVFDIPIKISEPSLPIGTHVIVAKPPAEGETALRWTALTMPVEIPPPQARIARERRSSMIETGSIGVAIPAETAVGALSRVQLTGEMLDHLSEYVWAGASVIISDRGINHETGVGTDFIIETKH
ncbi:MAG: L,D-transpeptidase family protein [Hyphomicrobiaceae bacterium]